MYQTVNILLLFNVILKNKGTTRLSGNSSWLLIISWAFYPVIYLFPMINQEASYVSIQVGYTIADVLSIGIFGVMIYMIAQRKSDMGA